MKNQINIKNYHFYNLPIPFKKKDYWDTCNLIEKKLKDNKNIESVYLQLGDKGEWVPGISDLDIILVYKDSIDLSIGIISPWSLSDSAKYIFIHNYGTYDKESFENLFYMLINLFLLNYSYILYNNYIFLFK